MTYCQYEGIKINFVRLLRATDNANVISHYSTTGIINAIITDIVLPSS